MKTEALEQTAIAARERARRLAQAAQKADGAARAAKDKAREAKARLKLAKREAKKLRQAAKAAKRSLAEALLALEKAAAEATSLEKRIQKLRRKGSHEQTKANRAPAPRRVVAKRPVAAAVGKPAAAKPPPTHASRNKPARMIGPEPAQPASGVKHTQIQVPRDFEAKPAAGAVPSGASTKPPGIGATS